MQSSLFSFLSFCVGGGLLFGEFVMLIFMSLTLMLFKLLTMMVMVVVVVVVVVCLWSCISSSWCYLCIYL